MLGDCDLGASAWELPQESLQDDKEALDGDYGLQLREKVSELFGLWDWSGVAGTVSFYY
jgi:hypothetical protein